MFLQVKQGQVKIAQLTLFFLTSPQAHSPKAQQNTVN